MEQPIITRFRWTADELLRAQDYNFRHSYGPVWRFTFHFIFALMILVGCGLIRRGGPVTALGFGFVAGGVYWFAVRRFARPWMIRRQFRKRPDRDMELEWQIAADKLRTRCSLGQSEFSWQTFAKMVRTPTGVMLYPVDQMFHWLPRTGFASDAEFEMFVELARTKIQRHYDAV